MTTSAIPVAEDDPPRPFDDLVRAARRPRRAVPSQSLDGAEHGRS